jgi:hypothetical protein
MKPDAHIFAARATRLLQEAGHRIKVRYDGGGWYRWKLLGRGNDGFPYRRDRIEEMMRHYLKKEEEN